MTPKYTCLRAALVVMIALFAFDSSAEAADKRIVVASATGSGNITVDGQLRTFSFTAQRDSSHNSRGQAELFNRSLGLRVHLAINCLSVTGNVASMSGTVTESTSTDGAYAAGSPFWFQVIDNGEDKNAQPDLISLVIFFFGPGVPCTSNLSPASIPIEGGNVQVR